jgi:hypothetical protein
MKERIEEGLIREVGRLPDWVLVKVHVPDREGQAWYATMDWGKYIYGNADFSTGGRTEDDVVARCAKTIRDDMRGIGKYAPHFDNYTLEYHVLPYWRRKKVSRKTETYLAGELVQVAKKLLQE